MNVREKQRKVEKGAQLEQKPVSAGPLDACSQSSSPLSPSSCFPEHSSPLTPACLCRPWCICIKGKLECPAFFATLQSSSQGSSQMLLLCPLIGWTFCLVPPGSVCFRTLIEWPLESLLAPKSGLFVPSQGDHTEQLH